MAGIKSTTRRSRAGRNTSFRLVMMAAAAALALALVAYGALINDETETENSEKEPLVVNSPSALPDLPLHPNAALTLDKNTSLDKDLVFDDGKHHVQVHITKGGVTLDCKGHSITGKAPVGILFRDISDVTIRNCNLKGTFTGILGTNIENVSIKGGSLDVDMNALHFFNAVNLSVSGVKMNSHGSPPKGYMAEIKKSRKVTVADCEAVDFDQGVLLYGTHDFNVSKNKISRIMETGIGTFHMPGVGGCGNGTISKNDVSQTLMGLEIHTGSKNIRIVGNKIAGNKVGYRIDDEHGTDRFVPVENIQFDSNKIFSNGTPYLVFVKDVSQIKGVKIENPLQ